MPDLIPVDHDPFDDTTFTFGWGGPAHQAPSDPDVLSGLTANDLAQIGQAGEVAGKVGRGLAQQMWNGPRDAFDASEELRATAAMPQPQYDPGPIINAALRGINLTAPFTEPGAVGAMGGRLVPAARGPEGVIRYGAPGEIHAELFTPAEMDIATPDYWHQWQLGFAEPDGPFMSRAEARDWIRQQAQDTNEVLTHLQRPGKLLDSLDMHAAQGQPRTAPLPARGFAVTTDYRVPASEIVRDLYDTAKWPIGFGVGGAGAYEAYKHMPANVSLIPVDHQPF